MSYIVKHAYNDFMLSMKSDSKPQVLIAFIPVISFQSLPCNCFFTVLVYPEEWAALSVRSDLQS